MLADAYEYATLAVLMLPFGVLAVAVWQIWYAMGGRRNKGMDQEATDAPRPCGGCGYDLRATAGKCPECGAFTVDRKRYLHALGTQWPDNPISPRVPDLGEGRVLLISTDDRTGAE